MTEKRSTEEYRDEFIDHVKYMVVHWNEMPNKSVKEKLEGLAFTILSAIDGRTTTLPAYKLMPVISDSEGTVGDDIAGRLHDLLLMK